MDLYVYEETIYRYQNQEEIKHTRYFDDYVHCLTVFKNRIQLPYVVHATIVCYKHSEDGELVYKNVANRYGDSD